MTFASVIHRSIMIDSSFITVVEVDGCRNSIIVIKDHGHRWPTALPANSSLMCIVTDEELFAFNVENVQHIQAYEAVYLIVRATIAGPFESHDFVDWFESYLD